MPFIRRINKKAPILITAYNRFKNFRKLLLSIKDYKAKIYISIDGPKNRYDKLEQSKIINFIRKNKKNFNIRYKILDQNFGCQKAIFSGLDWFFLKEKKGIILEDDTLPSPSFFKFTNKLLYKYEKDKSVFSVSGYMPYKKISIDTDYFFSKFFMCWGWATWRSRWIVAKKFTQNNRWTNILKTKKFNTFLTTDMEKKYFNKIYKKILSNQIDSWAFLWLLFGIISNSKFILPRLNLVKNTGRQTYGANNVPRKFGILDSGVYALDVKNHPKKNFYNKELDNLIFKETFNAKNLIYPWRALFLIKCLFLDPKFFFTKVMIFINRFIKFKQ